VEARDKYNLIKLGRTVFPRQAEWTLEALEVQGLPLYWNKSWLQEQLDQIGSTYLLAQQWNYPWGDLKRFAGYFGITTPTQQAYVGKFFLLDKEIVQMINEVKEPHKSRNRWIVEALESYFKEQEDYASGKSPKHAGLYSRSN